jgi:hypothetical protein
MCGWGKVVVMSVRGGGESGGGVVGVIVCGVGLLGW